MERLIDYALRYGSVALVKRLGWSLEQVGVDMRTLTPLLEVRSLRHSPLDPGLVRRGKYDRRWMIIDNHTKGRA
jgi:predicted transcriptional regulator of viral defense system